MVASLPAKCGSATVRQLCVAGRLESSLPQLRQRGAPHNYPRHINRVMWSSTLLDNRHRLIEFVELFRGTIDSAAVYPREVVKEALKRNAAALVLAHQHPSGVAEVSAADQLITRKLVSALETVGIRVLDHLIVAGGEVVSFAEGGLL